MQETDLTPDVTAARRPRPLLRRAVPVAAVIVVLVLIALVVPLINVNRFQRRIVTSLSESLGRPIHLDRISLTVLPLPGLTIENFVVAEDPAFGAEPFIRASEVRATLRFSSLWRRRLEFTRIRFTDPSINLVKSAQGKWNLESILLQAARIEAAPTAQARPSAAPRFPYIEATGARFNLKLDRGGVFEKTPISLTEAEFALWLQSPEQWRLRLDGRPMRTDTSVSDTGSVQMEGTLGRATVLGDVPIDLKAAWRNAPLGEASRVLLGHDAGLRGTMTLAAALGGTVGRGTVQAALHLTDLRRADFVPVRSLAFDAECQATQSGTFSALTDLRCSSPPAVDPAPSLLPASSLLPAAAPVETIALTGAIPETRRPASASLTLGTPGIPAATLLDWLHVASARASREMTATGTLRGSLILRPASPIWSGQFAVADATVTVPSIAAEPVVDSPLSLRAATSSDGRLQFVLAPVSLELGDRDFATLDGRFDTVGYTLHLTGTALPAKLLALGAALPLIGDGLPDALPPADATATTRFDLTSTRSWGSEQFWQGNRTGAPAHRPRP